MTVFPVQAAMASVAVTHAAHSVAAGSVAVTHVAPELCGAQAPDHPAAVPSLTDPTHQAVDLNEFGGYDHPS